MFSVKELELIHLCSRGVQSIDDLSKELDISNPETYRLIRNLRYKGVMEESNPLRISRCAFARRLYSIMAESPGFARFFCDRRLDVLCSLLTPQKLKSIRVLTGLSESYIRSILRIDMEGGLVVCEDGFYRINDSNHPKVRAFLLSLIDHMEVSDPRLPSNSTILFRDGDDVVYTTPDATSDKPTGFSALEDYGMNDWAFADTYYTTKSGELTLDSIFSDALQIAEAEDNWRLRMAAEVFYIKKKEQLNPPQEFIDMHNRIMSGERIKKWPSAKDIEDRLWTVEE
ncbi:MAG: hypothetical protein J6U12_06400 [Candidatus Methanomethylophilaceae archaeon]|nr:hypothetical protein [Candidatus Methanomethylophilaceae archaeon]MBP5686116.1 hypothetical protein [Candidatus Methanomethylophilaceae archaeon]MBP5735793.1 hypothetical protein [Candidatus Methanomethylophilaceae archaeon]